MLWEGDYFEAVQISIKSFARFHNVILWSYTNQQYIDCTLCDANEILDFDEFDACIGLFRSDLFRLHVINKFGGWWSDCDNFCVEKLPDLDNVVTLLNMEPKIPINNSLFTFPINSPILLECIKSYKTTGTLGFLQFHNILSTIYNINILPFEVGCNAMIFHEKDTIVFHLGKCTSVATYIKMLYLQKKYLLS